MCALTENVPLFYNYISNNYIRYKALILHFSHLKCTIQWLCMFRVVHLSPQPISEHHLQKEHRSYLAGIIPILALPTSPLARGNTNLLSMCIDLYVYLF